MHLFRLKAFLNLVVLFPFVLGLAEYFGHIDYSLLYQEDNEIKQHLSKMIYVEGGKFTQNSTSRFTPTHKDTTLFSSGMPKRTIVDSYFMSATEVTNAEWRSFYQDKVIEIGKVKAKHQFYPDTTLWISEFKYSYNEPYARNYFSNTSFDDFPVVGISWSQANAYCAWKTKLVNKLLSEKGERSQVNFRLPSEAEWEFASIKERSEAKFEKQNYYSWKDDGMIHDLTDKVNLGEVFDQNGVSLITYADDGCLYTCKVGAYSPNDKGIYNMSGNVSEWTADQAQIKVTSAVGNDSKSLSTRNQIENEIAIVERSAEIEEEYKNLLLERMNHDKIILSDSNVKVFKGGSWAKGLIYTQPGTRQGAPMEYKSVTLGFRISMSNVEESLTEYLPKSWRPSKK